MWRVDMQHGVQSKWLTRGQHGFHTVSLRRMLKVTGQGVAPAARSWCPRLPCLSCYDSDRHQSYIPRWRTSIDFDIICWHKVKQPKVLLYLVNTPAVQCAIVGETGNQKIAPFHSSVVLLHSQTSMINQLMCTVTTSKPWDDKQPKWARSESRDLFLNFGSSSYLWTGWR